MISFITFNNSKYYSFIYYNVYYPSRLDIFPLANFKDKMEFTSINPVNTPILDIGDNTHFDRLNFKMKFNYGVLYNYYKLDMLHIVNTLKTNY